MAMSLHWVTAIEDDRSYLCILVRDYSAYGDQQMDIIIYLYTFCKICLL